MLNGDWGIKQGLYQHMESEHETKKKSLWYKTNIVTIIIFDIQMTVVYCIF